MLMTGSGTMDAERAFRRAARGRRLAMLRRLLLREPEADRLPVVDERTVRRSVTAPGRGIREIPLEAINGTLEPGKASLFDPGFRPAAGVRARWERLWLAEHRGAVLPPISVVPSGDGYAVLDGHHRVSVAKARGAATIDARIDPAQLAAA
jgi:ParB-like nuclease domain